MTKTAFVAAVAACAFFTATADATPPPQPTNVELVTYTDLDLGSKVDQAKLKWRIHLAAMRVCVPDGYLALSCYDTALADALQQTKRAVQERKQAVP